MVSYEIIDLMVDTAHFWQSAVVFSAKSRPDSDLASYGGPVPYQVLGPPHLFAPKAKSTLMYVSNLLPCRLADSEYDLAEISFSIGRY